MKLTKWLTPLSIATLAIASGSFSLVGCNNQGDEPVPPGPTPPTDIEQFISDRTFSLRATSYFSERLHPSSIYAFSCWGTGWIIDDSTVSNVNDFKYYVATNWHVKRGMDTLPTTYQDMRYEGTCFYYADKSLATSSTGILDHYDYQEFDVGCFTYQPESNFVYSGPDYDQYDCIDMAVAECDFKDAPQSIKNKLLRLNEYRSVHHCINTFVDAGKDDIIIKNKYVAGYPVKESGDIQGGKWEYQNVPYSTDFRYYVVHTKEHDIDTEDPDYKYKDISPQYYWDVHLDPNWMSGGASGSMLITEDLEICGIYWGGYVDKKVDPTWFQPCFSLFLDERCSTDFISRWVNKN